MTNLILVDDPVFLGIMIGRVGIAFLGYLLMLTFKVVSNVPKNGDTSSDEVGLPQNEGWRRFIVIVGLVKLIANAPKRGIWLASHFLCMFSGFVGTVYMTVRIIMNGFSHDIHSLDGWKSFLLWFFEVGTLVQVVLMVVQVLLILLGFYRYHRWLGRFHVHLAVLTTVASIGTSTSPVVTIVLGCILVVEMPAYFAFTLRREVKSGEIHQELVIVHTTPKEGGDKMAPAMATAGDDAAVPAKATTDSGANEPTTESSSGTTTCDNAPAFAGNSGDATEPTATAVTSDPPQKQSN